MIRILFVCHGNICRSPMAEFIFRDMAEKAGKGGEFYVASAATDTDEIWGARGNPVYPPARRQLEKRGIDCSSKRAVLLRGSDYEKYDYFIGMDGENISKMRRLFRGDPCGKVRRLMDFAGGGDVFDPWYTRDFDTAYRDISAGCKGLFNCLSKRENDGIQKI